MVYTDGSVFRRRLLKRASHVPRLRDLLLAMLDELEFDPYRAGREHESLQNFWVYETARMYGIPTAFVLYEIIPESRVVTLWSSMFSLRKVAP